MQQQELMENDQISSYIDAIVNDLSEALQISQSDSTFILTQVGWEHIKIGDLFLKYNSIDQVLINLGLSHQIQNQQHNEPILCSICFTNQINISLSCNHQFCNDCLNSHIKEQLNYTCFPKCLYFQCNKIIPTIFYSHLEQFKNQLIQSVLKTKKKCGNKKCLNLIESTQQKRFIRCQCGYLNCALCQQGDHRPLSCAQAQQQSQLFLNLKENKKEFPQNNQQQCPKCLVLIEKTLGCNLMICRTRIGCGYQFCWICKETWSPIHYQCKTNQSQFRYISEKTFNTIPIDFKLKFQLEIKKQSDLDLLENCYHFLDLADNLSRKEEIYISNNPSISLSSFHQSFPYESFQLFKQKIIDILSACYSTDQSLSGKINLLSKYQKVANQFLDEYLDQFNQEQNQLK